MRLHRILIKMLTGVLVDVSGSMQESLQIKDQAKLEEKIVTRVQSIFTTILDIAKREVTSKNNQEIFALAFGLQDVPTCDLFNLLKYDKTMKQRDFSNGRENLIRLLEKNGAPNVCGYVIDYISDKDADFTFEELSKNQTMLRKLVDELPTVCKGNRQYSI